MQTCCMIIPLLQQLIRAYRFIGQRELHVVMCEYLYHLYADLDAETAFKSPYYYSVFHKNTFLIIIYIECDIVSRLKYDTHEVLG